MSAGNSILRDQVGALYGDHHSWLHGWLRKKTGCPARAGDLLHDTFMRLLALDELTAPQQPRAYLVTVAKRVLIDYWRRERVERAYLEALMQLPDEFAPGPEEQHLLLETLLEIDRRLTGLPIIVKRAFLYAQFEGLKQAEIADKLAISISSVKRYLTQAYTQCYFAVTVDR